MILKEFFDNKPLQKAWAEFILEELNQEALKRFYAGQDTGPVKEAKDIIAQSFKHLNELFTPKPKPRTKDRAV
jgi:hypothetical protein